MMAMRRKINRRVLLRTIEIPGEIPRIKEYALVTWYGLEQVATVCVEVAATPSISLLVCKD